MSGNFTSARPSCWKAFYNIGRTSCAVSAFRPRMPADCAGAANGKDGHTPAGAICDTGAFCSIRFCALRSAQNSVGIFVCMEV